MREGRLLTEEQKRENQKYNALQVKIEHIFADLKIIRIIKHRIRNYKFGFKHFVIFLLNNSTISNYLYFDYAH